MKCPSCGTENADDASFCANCGKKLRAVCPSCGATVSTDATFCPTCGKPLNAPAPAPAPAPIVIVAPTPAPAPAPAPVVLTGWRKWIHLSGSIVGFIGVLLSALFFFLFTLVSEDGTGQFAEISLARFGEIVDNIIKANSLAGFWSFLTMARELSNIGFFITLLFFAVFSIYFVVYVIIALVRYIKLFTGSPTRKSVEKITVDAYLLFLIASIFISSLWSNTNHPYHFGSVTVAGLIICAICLIYFIASRVALKGAQLKKAENWLPVAFQVAISVFAIVASVMAASAIFGPDSYAQYNFIPFIGKYSYPAGMEGFGKFVAFVMIGCFAMVCVHSVTQTTVRNLLWKTSQNKVYTALGSTIALVITDVVMLVAAILLVGLFAESGSYTNLIVSVVFAVLAMGTAIAYTVVDRNVINKTAPIYG